MPVRHADVSPSSVAATASGRMGDVIGEETLSQTTPARLARRRISRGSAWRSSHRRSCPASRCPAGRPRRHRAVHHRPPRRSTRASMVASDRSGPTARGHDWRFRTRDPRVSSGSQPRCPSPRPPAGGWATRCSPRPAPSCAARAPVARNDGRTRAPGAGSVRAVGRERRASSGPAHGALPRRPTRRPAARRGPSRDPGVRVPAARRPPSRPLAGGWATRFGEEMLSAGQWRGRGCR